VATVVANEPVSDAASRLTLDVPEWPGHLPGQHVDVRLTAADGYQAQRSYSIASAPEHTSVDLVVQRVDDGEVSPYLTDEVREGDQFELRGPIGGHFVSGVPQLWSRARQSFDGLTCRNAENAPTQACA
jgi:ferredoxin-NADP reductase